jgi:hypothetical protein
MFSVLYAANMYFQSFGAVSIVKVNAHWFHVTERGGFSGHLRHDDLERHLPRLHGERLAARPRREAVGR